MPLSEPAATALLVSIFGILALTSVLLSRAVDRLGVPVVLLFLVLGMLAGSEGIGKFPFRDYPFAVRVGSMALALILFDGGLNTPVATVRAALAPAGTLATAGVVLTAGLVAAFSHFVGLPWSQSLLLGAVVSSTDAAAVFAVLRGSKLRLQKRLAHVLELESCINDPMAVILTTTIIQVIVSHEPIRLGLLLQLPLQLAVGGGMGLLCGFAGQFLLRGIRLTTVGLYPAMTLALAFISFGTATLVGGSGFLSVYTTAVVIGARPLPYHSGLTRVHDALGWLCQIAMFLMLGLLVSPSQLVPVASIGLLIALFLAAVARPVAVWLCLAPFGYKRQEIGYLGWMGLRGAVPVILASFPLLAGVPLADYVFNIVFFIVVINSLVPGATIRWVTRWMGFGVPERPAPPAVLEINSSQPLTGHLVSFFVQPAVAVCGARLSEIEFPPAAAVVLIVRGQDLIAARGGTVLEAGDHVYVFHQPEDRVYVELLFGQPEEGAGG